MDEVEKSAFAKAITEGVIDALKTESPCSDGCLIYTNNEETVKQHADDHEQLSFFLGIWNKLTKKLTTITINLVILLGILFLALIAFLLVNVSGLKILKGLIP